MDKRALAGAKQMDLRLAQGFSRQKRLEEEIRRNQDIHKIPEKRNQGELWHLSDKESGKELTPINWSKSLDIHKFNGQVKFMGVTFFVYTFRQSTCSE